MGDRRQDRRCGTGDVRQATGDRRRKTLEGRQGEVRKEQSWTDATFSRFCVVANLTRRPFRDAMGEDATLLEKAQTRKTRRVTDVNFRVF